MKKYLITLLLLILSFGFINISVHASNNGSIMLAFDKNIYAEGDTLRLEILGNNLNDLYGVQIDILVPSGLSVSSTPFDLTSTLFGTGGTVYDNSYDSSLATLILIKNESPGYTVDSEQLLAVIYFNVTVDIDDTSSIFTVSNDFDDITYGLANFCVKLSDSSASPLSYDSLTRYDEYAFYLNGDSSVAVEAGEEYVDLGVFYPASAVVETSTNFIDTSVVGTYTYTYHLTDGDVDITLTRTVEVYDSTPPTFIVPSAIEVGASDQSIDFLSYVTNVYDVADSNPTIEIINPIGNYRTPGVYTILVIVKDASDNSQTKTITVTIYDHTAPSFTVSNQTIQAEEYTNIDWTSYITNATDNATGSLTYAEISDNVNYSEAGTYSVTVRVSDASGNYTDKTFSVTVEAVPVETFTVTFYQEDGVTVISTVEVNSGDTVFPPDYKVVDFTTKGWLLEGNQFDFTTPITEDIELTALLVKNTGCFAALFGDIGFVLFSLTGVITLIYIRKR